MTSNSENVPQPTSIAMHTVCSAAFPFWRSMGSSSPSASSSSSSSMPPSEAPSPTHVYPLHWYRRLGGNGMRILSIGTLAILGGFSFLVFLWRGSEANPIWKYIVITGWASQAATLTVELIKLVLASQVAIATSMLASIALESFQVALPQAPAINIMRFTNMGPNDLAAGLRSGFRKKDLMSATAVVFPLVVTTFLSQFLSTVLLWDMDVGYVVGHPQMKILRTQRPVEGNGTIDHSNRKDYFLMAKCSTFPAFAEYSTGNMLEDGVSDTGVTLRAFLPLASEIERTRLHSYHGDATVFDARVVCAPPTFTIATASIRGNELGEEGFDIMHLVGRLLVARDIHQVTLRQPWPASGIPFNCSASLPLAPGEQPDAKPQIPLTLCLWYAGQTGGLKSELGSSDGGWTYMVLQTTGSRKGWYSFLHDHSITDWDYSERDEWMELSPAGSPTFKISASLCTAALSVATFVINATSTVPRTEPVLEWDFERGDYETGEIRKQLGAVPEWTPPKDRGLLTLEYEPNTWQLGKNGTREMIEAAYGAGPAYAKLTNSTTMMCTRCYDSPVMHLSSGTKWVNPSHISLFQEIIRTTGRPGLAVQAHFTTLVQMVYYDRLPSFQALSNVELDEYIQVTVPKGSAGFAATLALVTIHLLLVAIVATRFCSNVQFSIIESAWSCTLQGATLMAEGEDEEVLRTAHLRDDSHVERLFTREKRHKTRVGIRAAELGTVGLMRLVDAARGVGTETADTSAGVEGRRV